MKRLPLEEILAGVAEGACELGWAALELRRVITGVNPAAMDKQQAIARFEEELADLELYLDRINYNRHRVNDVKDAKLERWEARMDARGGD